MISENPNCLICQITITNGILVLPCSHYQLCYDCFLKLDHKCPQCRSVIEYYLQYSKKTTKIQKIGKLDMSISDHQYDTEYFLYHINNRSIPYTERVLLRRLSIAGFNIDSSSLRNNHRNRFRTWWPE